MIAARRCRREDEAAAEMERRWWRRCCSRVIFLLPARKSGEGDGASPTDTRVRERDWGGRGWRREVAGSGDGDAREWEEKAGMLGFGWSALLFPPAMIFLSSLSAEPITWRHVAQQLDEK
jgi:hypothetical protein